MRTKGRTGQTGPSSLSHALSPANTLSLRLLAAAAETGDGYWQGVRKAGVLRCGAAVAPPYVMRDPASSAYPGFFADLCREFAATLKVEPKFIDTTWDNIVAGLQAGKWDLSMALNRTPAPAMAVRFSGPAMEYQISLAYNKSNPKIPAGDSAAVQGVRLATVVGEPIPLETERGYHTQIMRPGLGLRHSSIWSTRAFMVTPTAGGIRVGGTVDMTGLDAPPDYRRAQITVRRTREALPSLRTGGAGEWMGHRPARKGSGRHCPGAGRRRHPADRRSGSARTGKRLP